MNAHVLSVFYLGWQLKLDFGRAQVFQELLISKSLGDTMRHWLGGGMG